MAEHDPKTEYHYGPQEKPHILRTVILWLLIIAAIAGTGWMIWENPPEKALVCREGVPHSLTYFGYCTTE
jgi:hypothetical protein